MRVCFSGIRTSARRREKNQEKAMNQTSDSPGLKNLFKQDFLIGAALSADQILGKEPAAAGLVLKHCSSITPENVLKWEEVHPEPDRYNFDVPDRYVEFGEKNGMFIVGHCLVWHYQTPAWVFQDQAGKPLSREALIERMRDHIFTVVGRYKGRIRGWDVVNESIMADGSFRKSGWYEIIGEDYVRMAFEFARQADPDAELYDFEYRPKLDGVIRLVRGLQSSGVRVDGVGIQGHWFLDFPAMNLLEEYVKALSLLEVPLMITELDIGVVPFVHLDDAITDLASFDAETRKKLNPYPDGLPEAVAMRQAGRYGELFAFFRKRRDLFSRVTFWGVHDAQSWRSYLPIRGRADYPMLFDKDCKPKPAFDAVVRAGLGK
jgi:endo-1,4-beta-xylanase